MLMPSHQTRLAAMFQAQALIVTYILLSHLCTAHAALSYSPKEPLKGVDVWTNANAAWFRYPEASDSSNYYIELANSRPNFGIALSGGGYRAVTLALGYVRALHMLGLTQQARYLSSNSGGSWFNSAYSYQQLLPVNQFLGPYVPPQELGMDALKQVKKGSQGAFATTISESSIIANGVTGAVIDIVTGSQRGPGAWSLSVGEAFLKPYNLNADKSTVTANGTKGPIHPVLGQLQGIDVYAYQASYDKMTDNNVPRPFPIVLGTIFSRVQGATAFYPVEFTPLYIGCPAVFPNTSDPAKTVGGGFVDPQGFNSAPPKPVPDVPTALASNLGPSAVNPPAAAADPSIANANSNTTAAGGTAVSSLRAAQTAQPAVAGAGRHRALLQATTPANQTVTAAEVGLNAQLPLTTTVDSTFVVPLKVMMGISSSFLAQGLRPDLEGALAELTGTEDLEYWNQVNFKGERRPFADGGGTDNLAVTPLLRRGITHIVSCIASITHIDNTTNIDDYAIAQWDIAGLFGAVPLKHETLGKRGQIKAFGLTPEELNTATQVFPTSAWPELFEAFRAGTASGGPMYHLATYTVMDNPAQAIKGGWEVKVLWVANALQQRWEALLPADTQGTLAKSRFKNGGLYEDNKELLDAAPDAGTGMVELRMFPYISTFDANYGPELTGLLSQLATWQMLELKPQLQQLVEGTGATVGDGNNVGTATSNKNVGNPDKRVPTSAAGVTGVGSLHMCLLALVGLIVVVLV